MKIAVIIKHPYRDYDYRVDIVDVPEGTEYDKIRTVIERQMLGPFQIIAMTEKLNLDRKIVFPEDSEEHTSLNKP